MLTYICIACELLLLCADVLQLLSVRVATCVLMLSIQDAVYGTCCLCNMLSVQHSVYATWRLCLACNVSAC